VALLLAPRRGVPVLARAAVLGALVYLGCLPAVRAVDEAQGDPSTQRSFWTEPRDYLAHAIRPGERVEVAFTHNHWEATYLATAVPLARGWERQLDEKANPIFYDGRPLTPRRYHEWLRRNAVRFVVLPSAPLDYSSRQEARLAHLRRARRRPAGVRRRPGDGRRPRRVRRRGERPDRRARALHALLALGRRLRHPRRRRLDPGGPAPAGSGRGTRALRPRSQARLRPGRSHDFVGPRHESCERSLSAADRGREPV
jgi:hypothetical protein